MEINAVINEALLRIKPSTVFRLANEARPSGDYIFANYLPERTDTSYEASSATMSIRTAMAGLAAMDSPYPKGGVVQVSQFLEKIAKFAIEQDFTEQGQRKLQEIVQYLLARGNSPISTIVENLYNFTDKLLVQPHLDTMEWLRGQALLTGGIDWTYNDIELKVDYGVPSEAFLSNRTGTDAWIGSTSKFWDDIRAMKKYLRYDVNAFIMHPDTLDAIISNPANNIIVTAQTATSFTVGRNIATLSGGQAASTDKRDTVTLVAYGAEAEVLDTVNPGKTKLVRFMPAGKILAIGNNNGNKAFVLINGVNQGATQNPNLAVALGYTHIGPTVEGDGRAGRWARVFRPEAKPWAIVGQSVQNALPVIENPLKLVVASSDLS